MGGKLDAPDAMGHNGTTPNKGPQVSYASQMQEIFDSTGNGDWDAGDGTVIYCPDGYPVETDGQCPDGHVSPLRAMGMI